jgi:hypothetical protein
MVGEHGCQMHKKSSGTRTWSRRGTRTSSQAQHGESPSPPAPPSESTQLKATAPIELAEGSPRLLPKRPRPPAPFFPDSNRRRRRRVRVVGRDSPSGGLRRPPVPTRRVSGNHICARPLRFPPPSPRPES